MKNKKYYRELVKGLREGLSKEDKEKRDRAIYNNIIQSKEFIEAKCIFIYVSYKNEVDTHTIIKTALSEGKIVCVPKIISLKEGMKVLKIRGFDELKASSYGILEPEQVLEENIVSPWNIDLVYTPGVAFDLKGGRIGYGGGFYDRFLSSLKEQVPKFALAYSFQVFHSVPMDENDQRVDGVISEVILDYKLKRN
jgi:5-formyltetrahydrofolate cyclo-ligase